MRVLLALAPLLATGATAPVFRYELDGARSAIDARVTVMGLAQKSANFPRMSGTFSLSPERPDAVALAVAVDARALSTRDKDVERQLKGEDFLDVEHHPVVSFTGQRLTMTGPLTGTVSGQLTARGMSRPAVLQVSFAQSPAQADGRQPVQIIARTTIDRRQFGMTSHSLVVGRNVTITIRARMVPD